MQNRSIVEIPPAATIALGLHREGRTDLGRDIMMALYRRALYEAPDEFEALFVVPQTFTLDDLADRLERGEGWVKSHLPRLAEGPDAMWIMQKNGGGFKVRLHPEWRHK